MSEDKFIKTIKHLEPVLNGEGKKCLHALSRIMDAFPGKSLIEVEKSIVTLKHAARTTLPMLQERAMRLCALEADEDLSLFIADAKKLSVSDIKKLGRGLNLSLAGKKDDMLASIEKWINSRGTIYPRSEAEIDLSRASELASKARPMLSQLTQSQLRGVLEIVDEAYTSLKGDGFSIFAREIGLDVSGSKPAMKKKLIDLLKRLAVSQNQTRF